MLKEMPWELTVTCFTSTGLDEDYSLLLSTAGRVTQHPSSRSPPFF